jgi:ribosomal protein S18 acetylase RimI-like enzyme
LVVPSAIEVVPSVERDLAQLFLLARSAFADLPGWSDERVLQVLKLDLVFVAREQGQLAGYVALRRDTDKQIVVEQLFVAPGHERRGIGRRLLAHAEGYAISERARSLRIVVEENNHPARRFYRRAGFVPLQTELFELVLPQSD